MVGHEQKDALIAHGRELLEIYKGKKVPNTSRPASKSEPDISTRNTASEHQKKDALWNSILNAFDQNTVLSDSIERNALKLVDYIQSYDKGNSSNLAQLAAPVSATIRQQCRQKQQIEGLIHRDIQSIGPPLEINSNNESYWLSNEDVQKLVDTRVGGINDELNRANQTIKGMEIKLNAYKIQLQQSSNIASAPSSQSNGSLEQNQVANGGNAVALARQILEKDELIAALKETLDEVARETTRMEKLIVNQMDTIAELKQSKIAQETSPITTIEESENDPRSQQSDNLDELVPADDGHAHKIEDFETPLPPGWESRVTNSGNVYFVHAKSKVTTWVDPRTHPIQVQPATESSGNNTAFIPVPSSHYSIEFHDKRRIGILFQPNAPLDIGAKVRKVMDDTPAALAKQINPGHQLVAVNGHHIHDASFKHVMLLLQGGYRPLTLTFDRVVRVDNQPIDNATSKDGPPQDLTFADRIITSVFSMMWSLPEDTVEHI